MAKALRLLHVEDNAEDAELIAWEVRRGGYEVDLFRVDTGPQMQEALIRVPWDVVIADYSLPHFSAPEALFLSHRLCPELPFIVLSGTMGEDTAVEMMRNGADDYLMKDNLARLVPSIEHALQGAADRWERRRAEEALRQSLQDYETLYKAIPGGVLVLNASGEIVKANDFACQILRLSSEQLIGHDLSAIGRDVVLEDGSPLRPSDYPLKATLTEARPLRELVARLRVGEAGEPAWLLTSAEAILDPITGRPAAAVLTLLDRTEHRRAEQALRDSERRFREMAELMPDMLFELSLAGDITYVNRAARETLGYGPSDMPASFLAFLDEDDQQHAKARWAAIAAGGASQIDNHELIHREGQRIPVEAHTVAVRDDDGTCVDFRAVLRNTTERQRAQRALRESEARFRVLYEEAPVPYQSLDENGCITEINPRWLEILGYERDEVIGHSFADFLIPLVRPVFPERFAAFKATGTISGVEWPMFCKDGATLVASFEGRIAHRPDGSFKQTHCVFQDVTEAQRLQNEVLKTQKLESLGVLAGGIAHDFNNALLVIMGNLQMARLFPTADERHARHLLNAESACDQARDLTGQLLTFARGGAPVMKTACLTSLVRDTALFAVSGSKVKCVFELAEEVRPVEADLGQISQVINNLVLNADQAMPSGGTLRLGVHNAELDGTGGVPLPPGSYVRLTVADEGIGISPDVLERIFDPYFTTKSTGNGLGLASCFSIIHNHGGHIGVESAPGVGTTFTIYLPCSTEQVTAAEEVEETILPGEGRVLVMDDEEAVRDFARMILEEVGYEVAVTREGQEAIASYEQALEEGRPFAAVVLDLTIRGGAGGRSTMAQLLRIDPNVRAVVCSGYSADPVMANYRDHGFRAVVVKPYGVAELATAVHRAIEEG